ncbi:unnamed protein product [Blepharisma stoltei]|uniref:LITAF domain-containing protein n=1 Tax=Blepharisma stoltei TaxID=1481888 RepID=A0AAU9IE76_9CILI|nr:unnamed protein product [Blepharisma stoltei]
MDKREKIDTSSGNIALNSLFSNIETPEVPYTKNSSRFYESPTVPVDKSLQSPSMRTNLQDTRDTNYSTRRSTFVRKTISPRRTLPKNPFLLGSAVNEINQTDKSVLTQRLQEKLKQLEEEFQSGRKSETSAISRVGESFIAKHEEVPQAKSLETTAPVPWNNSFGEAKFASLMEDENENSDIPTLRWCAFCKGEVMTDICYTNSSKTFWSAVGIFLAGGVFGCFILPYMTHKCKDMKMVCHICKRTLS